MGWFGRNKHVESQLSAFMDGELNARQAGTVERHLDVCNECAALLQELRGNKALLATLPRQTPRRSFVLGAEYERRPASQAGSGAALPRRPQLAFVPAMALVLFAALLIVDAGQFGGSSDDATETTAFQTGARQAEEADGGSAGAAALAPPQPQSDAADDAAGSTAAPQPFAGEADAGPNQAEAASAAEGDQPDETPALSLAEASATGEDAAQDVEDMAAEPEEDGGISTLRVLQILAGSAFLASALYVFVWPRLSKGN